MPYHDTIPIVKFSVSYPWLDVKVFPRGSMRYKTHIVYIVIAGKNKMDATCAIQDNIHLLHLAHNMDFRFSLFYFRIIISLASWRFLFLFSFKFNFRNLPNNQTPTSSPINIGPEYSPRFKKICPISPIWALFSSVKNSFPFYYTMFFRQTLWKNKRTVENSTATLSIISARVPRL